MEFELPEFLEKLSVDEIFKRMRELIPRDIDMSPASIPWDLTYPTAYVSSELAQFTLPWFLQQVWAQFAKGKYLEYHAERRRMARKPASASIGSIMVTGAAGTIIPIGTVFATASKNDIDSVEFFTTEEAVILEGSVDIPIEAAIAGSGGNVAANTIILKVTDGLDGVETVTNPNATAEGYDQEDDESLRTRILEYDQTPGSYIGNEADYKRWAMSVLGVGGATVIPAQDNSGLVTVIIIDSNGDPASDALCHEVYAYIMDGDNPLQQRLAPIGATLLVEPPTTTGISVTAVVETDAGTYLADIRSAFLTALSAYFVTASDEHEIRYTQISTILASISGVHDFKDLLLNGGTRNIPIDHDEVPVIRESDVVFVEGVV